MNSDNKIHSFLLCYKSFVIDGSASVFSFLWYFFSLTGHKWIYIGPIILNINLKLRGNNNSEKVNCY